MPDGVSVPPLRHVAMTTDTVGGVWQYSLELSAGLIELGLSVTLVTLGPPPSDAQMASCVAAGIRPAVTDLPLDWTAATPQALAAASLALADRLSAIAPDTVHLHAPALLAVRPALPTVVVAHSCVATWWRAVRGAETLPPDLAWRTRATARGLALADAVIAPSRAFAETLRAEYHLDRMVAIVYNGRDLSAALPGPRAPVVLTAGRLWDPAKNVALLDGLSVPVEAAGPVRGPSGSSITLRHARALGTLEAAALTERMATSAVFASPALYEPFGLAILEAAAAGCALVLSDIPTLKELWFDAAVFLPATDGAAWDRELAALLRDPARIAELGRAASARATGFGRAAMVDATLALHRATLRQRAAV